MAALLTDLTASVIVALGEVGPVSMTDLARITSRPLSSVQRATEGLLLAGVVARDGRRGPLALDDRGPVRALRELAEWQLGRPRTADLRRRAGTVVGPGELRPPSTISNPRIRAAWPAALGIIVREFEPEQVLLFGSQARGDARPDSDVDLLVVMDRAVDKRAQRVAIRRALARMPFGKDVLVATSAELADPAPGTAIRDALHDAVVGPSTPREAITPARVPVSHRSPRCWSAFLREYSRHDRGGVRRHDRARGWAMALGVGKYAPLAAYLAASTAERVTLPFDRLNELVDGLPPSASAYRPWWANTGAGGHVQARAWMAAGFMVETVSLGSDVTFVRTAGLQPAESRTTDSTAGTGADSREQRQAEAVLLKMLADRFGTALRPRVFTRGRIRVAVDGFTGGPPPVLVEIWAHQGVPKSAQKHKVMTDAAKLAWLDRVECGGTARKVLVFADPAAAAHFTGVTWMAEALREMQFEVVLLDLGEVVRARLVAAQARQAQFNRAADTPR